MIEVAAAIIDNGQGQILIARRRLGKSQAGMWEFPGGKLERGESVEQCLIRELEEEMNIRIEPYEWFGQCEYAYEDAAIRLIAYRARYIAGEIQLTDHDEYRWVQLEELHEYSFAPADVEFVERLTVKFTLKQAYNQQAAVRDQAQIEAWKCEERDQVLDVWNREGVHRMLEIGAGPGRDSLFFQQQRFQVTAVDLSDAMIQLCRDKGLDARVMDFYELNFADAEFDAVYAMNCLLHVPKAELHRVLSEIHRVLKPEGMFFLGLYGGRSTEGIWAQDSYEPKRYFAMYPDEELVRITETQFTIEEFHTRFLGEDVPHFQYLMLRKS